jgi:MFS family permease
MHFVTTARFLSSIGDGFALVAFPLLATTLTHSPVLIAGVAFSGTLPWLLFGLAAGVMVDRVSRRKLLTVVELSRTAVLVLLAVAIATHHLALVMVYAAAFVIAAFETLYDSSMMAVIPQLTPDGDLVRANSRFQVAQLSGEQFIGAALGGLAFAAAASIPIFADGATFAVSAALLAIALQPIGQRRRHARGRRRDGFALSEPVRVAGDSILGDIKSGLRWLVAEPRLRLLACLIPGFAFCQALGLGILVLYCTQALHLSGTGFGIFVAATASGNAIGAWAAPRTHGWLGAGRTLLLAGTAGGAAYVLVGVTSAIGVALFAMWVEAFAVGVGTVAQVTLRQRLVPLELAGRVSSAMRTSTLGAAAAGTLIGGGIVALVGVHAPFAIGGAAQVVVALLVGGALIRRLAVARKEVVDVREPVDMTASRSSAEA